jgi:predicted RNase H-like HicB family nuclease
MNCPHCKKDFRAALGVDNTCPFCGLLVSVPCSTTLNARGPIEIYTGMVRLNVITQKEFNGKWVARVENLTEHCQEADTLDEAIRLACEAVSVSLPNSQDH